VKTFHDEQKTKKFITTKPPLKKILKGIPPREEEDKHKENIGEN
jgi:hypothetical protein